MRMRMRVSERWLREVRRDLMALGRSRSSIVHRLALGFVASGAAFALAEWID